MSFWTTSNFTYRSFGDQPKEKLVTLIDKLTRDDLIEWLSWNDPNGIYHDSVSLKELGNIMSRGEGVEIMLRQIEENRIAVV